MSRCLIILATITHFYRINSFLHQKDGGALVVNIFVFDLRVQLQHCTYQRKTLLFALIKVRTFICKREISGFSPPLKLRFKKLFIILLCCAPKGDVFLN